MTALTAIAAAPAAAANAAPSIDRVKWDMLASDYRETKQAYAAAAARFDSIYTAYEEKKPSIDIIDWNGLRPFCCARVDEHAADTLDVEHEWQILLDGEGKWWWSPKPEETKAKRRAALDTVLEYRQRCASLKQQLGYDQAGDECERTSEAAFDAEKALINSPAPDLEALHLKLEILFGPEATENDGSIPCWTASYVSPVIADWRRLLGGRAA